MLVANSRLRALISPVAILLLAAFLRLVRLGSVPFGWHPDEATKALLARDVLAGEYFPVFFSAFTGREALFVYLEAVLFSLMGEGIFIGRLLSALIGILTVALTFATGRRLINRRAGLVAAAFLAVSLWHLIASRNGYRAVLQPLVQLPAILLLFDGLRRDATHKKKLEFSLAGLFLGLSLYTYTAVRLFPFLILALMILLFLFDRPRLKANLGHLLLMFAVAALVVSPLALYFWRNPDDFIGRAAQVSVFSAQWAGDDPLSRLWQSARETGRMWTQWGDINYRFNISGQPVFSPVIGLLFYAGLVMTVWRALLGRGLTRIIYLLLLAWTLIMLLPMMLSAESLPYYQRAIGVLPAIYFFPAITVDALLGQMEKRLSRPMTWPAPALSIFLIFILAIFVYHDYFVTWNLALRNDDDRRVAMTYVADYLNGRELDQPLYLSTQYVQHPTLALLAPQKYDGIHWFDARQSLPLPPEGEEATYILLAENRPQAILLEDARGLEQTATEYDRFGRPVFEVYQWQAGPNPVPGDQTAPLWSWETDFLAEDAANLRTPIRLPVNFGDVLFLEGHDRSASIINPGEAMHLVLYWRLGKKPERQYTIFAHLLDAQGKIISGFDANEYPTSFWREEGGEFLLSYIPLTIPGDTPPGEYQLEIGVYNQASGDRLPVLDAGEFVADRLLLSPIEIPVQ